MSSETKTRISRRRILTWGGMTLAAVAAGSIGWQFRPTVPAAFPERALDGAISTMPRLLIVYGSRLGSTAEQAIWMGETASRSGFAVQVSRAENAPRADDFDAVILGSAIRSSNWLPEPIQWAADNRGALAQMPHALFEASMSVAGILANTPDHSLKPEHLEKLARNRRELDSAAPVLASAPVAYLPGCLDYEKLSPMLRIGFPFASGTLNSGDFRDEQMVHALTETGTWRERRACCPPHAQSTARRL